MIKKEKEIENPKKQVKEEKKQEVPKKGNFFADVKTHENFD